MEGISRSTINKRIKVVELERFRFGNVVYIKRADLYKVKEDYKKYMTEKGAQYYEKSLETVRLYNKMVAKKTRERKREQRLQAKNDYIKKAISLKGYKEVKSNPKKTDLYTWYGVKRVGQYRPLSDCIYKDLGVIQQEMDRGTILVYRKEGQ